ncbi:MAG TPA: ATP-binding protein [Pyrinomonadaceae bacterium]|nr:ATP-binding protein [Pyrinomonadaceae bacterium]
MSLRTRLALLAGFAIVALVIAAFVAWRLARATETFALRQADSAVHAAARDLSLALETNPDGFQTLDEASPGSPGKGRNRGPRGGERGRPAPPHVQKLFAAYSDPLARLTAITLHRYENVAGGFYRGDELTGYALSRDQNSSAPENAPAEVADTIRAAASESARTNAAASRTLQIGTARVIMVAYPIQQDGITAAWAMQRVSHLSGVSDWPNLAALIAMGLSIFAVSGLALLTVRDLRRGVTGIETGLTTLTSDLNQHIPEPETAELARIAAAINQLAATLRANIERQTQLERNLRQSERLSALGRVVAGVAHEVRNPLASIKLKVQLARRADYSSEKLAETVDVVCAEIERLDSLVRRLLELGGQQKLDLAAIDLQDLVRRRVAFFNDLATRAGVSIVNNSSPHNIFVEADSNRLGQVVDNIIQNALDAMPNGGQLTITCDRLQNQDGWASMRFEDTGPGIKPADQKNIFEPFYTNRVTGTGLGLAIARAIVEEHGGRIRFDTEVGHGTSFVVELPLPARTKNRESLEA